MADSLSAQDFEFLEAFHKRAVEKFGHAEHIQLAWIILRHHELAEGEQIISDGIREFAADHNAAEKYHETLTLFWTRTIHHAIQNSPDVQDLKSLIKKFPSLSDSRLPLRHWNPTTLWSETARARWVEPDVEPLPF